MRTKLIVASDPRESATKVQLVDADTGKPFDLPQLIQQVEVLLDAKTLLPVVRLTFVPHKVEMQCKTAALAASQATSDIFSRK